jgi:hypothetical protein
MRLDFAHNEYVVQQNAHIRDFVRIVLMLHAKNPFSPVRRGGDSFNKTFFAFLAQDLLLLILIRYPARGMSLSSDGLCAFRRGYILLLILICLSKRGDVTNSDGFFALSLIAQKSAPAHPCARRH